MSNQQKGPVTEVVERCERLEQDCTAMREEYLRSLADFENFRKRMHRELEQVRQAAHAEVMADLIPVLDNFSRALAATGPAGPNDNVRKGVEMIRQQLHEALSRRGLAEFSCIGQPFDPRCAEAISFIATDKHADGTVVEEVCRGYSCGDRIIRPAKVVVAKPAGQDRKVEQNAEVIAEE